jgi:tetratricopeptide (TPR) repeat protein
VKPTYRNLKKELEKFGRKVAHDRKGLTADVPWPETPCVLVRLSALDPGLLESLRPFRTVAGLQALARLLRKAGVRVVCCRDACVHADPEAGADPPRAREEAAVRALARAEAADDPAAARVEARAAADAMPDWAEAQNELGKRSYRQGETESARIAFERAAALSPDWAEPHGNLGVMFWEAGDADRAVEAFNRAVAIEPENADVLYNVGMIYEQVGDSRRAALFFERCRALRPDDPDVRSRLEAIRVTSPEMATAP